MRLAIYVMRIIGRRVAESVGYPSDKSAYSNRSVAPVPVQHTCLHRRTYKKDEPADEPIGQHEVVLFIFFLLATGPDVDRTGKMALDPGRILVGVVHRFFILCSVVTENKG